MIAFAPASRCRAVIRQALIAYDEKPASTASAAGTRTSAAQGSSLRARHRGRSRRVPRREPRRRTISIPDPVVRGDPERDACERHPLGANDRLPAEARQEGEREPNEHREQPAEHVQLRVEVDDHGTRIAAPVEQLVHRRERLDRPLQRPDRECRAPRQHEAARRAAHAEIRTRDERASRSQNAREHRDARGHDQERMDRGRFLCLLRGQAAAYDEAALVEPEVHGRRRRTRASRRGGRRSRRSTVRRDGARPPSSGAK